MCTRRVSRWRTVSHSRTERGSDEGRMRPYQGYGHLHIVNGIFSPAGVMGETQKKKYGSATAIQKRPLSCPNWNVQNYLPHQNATIINASMLSFARHTISVFQSAIHCLKLSCPVFFTQNDGTILRAADAARLPTHSTADLRIPCVMLLFLVKTCPMSGVLVLVIGIQGSEKWTSTKRGIDIGGPLRAFGTNIDSQSLGKFREPKSVNERNIHFFNSRKALSD